eukprot:1714105-Amphidinium_carterae.1
MRCLQKQTLELYLLVTVHTHTDGVPSEFCQIVLVIAGIEAWYLPTSSLVFGGRSGHKVGPL